MSDPATFVEGNTKYRVTRRGSTMDYVITADTWVNGTNYRNFTAIRHGLVWSAVDALEAGVKLLRPVVAKLEPAVVKFEDPEITRQREIDAEFARQQAVRDQIEAEIREEREIAARMLDEQNPLWGAF